MKQRVLRFKTKEEFLEAYRRALRIPGETTIIACVEDGKVVQTVTVETATTQEPARAASAAASTGFAAPKAASA